MSPSKDTSQNRFDDLPMDTEDPSVSARSNLQSMSALANALPQTAEQPPAAQGTKRPAPTAEPFSMAALQKRLKAFKDRAAQKARQEDAALPAAASGTVPSKTMAEVVKGSVATDKQKVPPRKAFPFKDVQGGGVKMPCSLSVDGCPAIGTYSFNDPALSLRLLVDAGRFGDPKISLNIRLRISQLVEGQSSDSIVYERARITWRPGVSAGNGFEISNFEEASTDQWLKDTPGSGTILIASENVKERNDKHRTLTFFARRGFISYSESFAETSHRILSKPVLDILNKASQDNVQLRFFYIHPGKTYYLGTLPHFRRCVDERLEPYHQYRENGRGPFKLTDIEEAQSIQEVGEGMYLLPTKRFQQLPVLEDYTAEEFMATCALTSVREGQYQKSKGVDLKAEPRECFVFQPPMYFNREAKVAHKDMSEVQQSFNDWVFIYIRLPSQGKLDWIPELGTTINLEWEDLGPVFRQHRSGGKKFFGVVVRRDLADLTATRTDFCICMRMPAGFGPKRHQTLVNVPQLPKTYLTVETNLRPILRELNAVNQIASSDRVQHTDFLRCMRQRRSFAGNVSSTVDLSEGNCDHMEEPQKQEAITRNKRRFAAICHLYKKELDNEDQARVLDDLCSISDHHMAVAGPSGTGKTNVIKKLSWLLVTIGHKLAICCPSNNGLDHVATNIWESKPAACERKKQLRMEIHSIERETMLQDLTAGSTADARKLPGDVDPSASIEDDPRITKAWEYIIAEHADDEEKFDQFESYVNRLKDLKDVSLQAQKATSHIRPNELPYEITLGYHIRRICQEDMARAQEEYNREKQLTDISLWGDLATVEDRCISHPYTQWQEHFIRREGRLNKEETEIWLKVRGEMMARVLKDIDILCVTLNNASHEFSDLGFEASLLAVDEAGQASFPAIFVPMVAFKKWKALLMFGDPQQLTPTIMARFFSEVADRSRISPLQIAYNNNHNLYLLREQYRMAEAIHQCPNQQFYNGQLKCNPKALADNRVRELVRQVSFKHYGIRGEASRDDGSEYFFIDVVNGSARVEPQGTSLLNYANVDAIRLLVDRLVAAGVSTDCIVILSMYKAELKLLALKITRLADGRKKYHAISTTDAFQGQESSVVILDLVIAKDFRAGYSPSDLNVKEDDVSEDEDLLTSKGKKYGDITSFARDYHRTCLALTRATDGLIVVGQLARLISSLRPRKDPLANTLHSLAANARKRKLVATDRDHTDTHPKAVQEREAGQKQRTRTQEERSSEAARFSFIAAYENWGHQASKEQPKTAPKAPPEGLFGTQKHPGRVPLPSEMQTRKNKGKGKKRGTPKNTQQKPGPKTTIQQPPEHEPGDDDTAME
ncbi:MAG: hypothetical protein Q9188_003022 [Gyalolechia gomerana]